LIIALLRLRLISTTNSLADSLADVLAAATQVGANIRIELNANNTLIIENLLITDLDAGDFIFKATFLRRWVLLTFSLLVFTMN